jgi:hypothetical protein
MKRTGISFAANLAAILLLVGGDGLPAGQEPFSLTAPNGVSFSEIRGYETWQVIAPSHRTDKKELRVILGNAVMIDAYQNGIPGNGRPFPEKAVVVKIGWSERKSPDFPDAFEPDTLKRVELIMKDSKRFPGTHGWGFARFLYNARTGSFTPYGKDASFAGECFQCHSSVNSKDFIFTGYPRR